MVDIDGVVDGGGEAHGHLRRSGHQLNPLHVDHVRADLRRHGDAVAGGGGHVGAADVLAQRRPVLVVRLTHFDVGGKAARRQHDTLVRLQREGRAVRRHAGDADHAAILHEQLVRLEVQADFAAQLFKRLLLRIDERSALRAPVLLHIVRAAPGRAHARVDVVPDRPQILQECYSFRRLAGKQVNQLRVAHIVALDVGLQRVQSRGIVQVVVTVGLIGLDVLAHIGLPLRHQLAARLQRQHVFDDGHFRGFHRQLTLTRRIGSVHGAARRQRVAAGVAHLVDGDDGRAVLRRHIRRGHARAAGADDDDVRGPHDLLRSRGRGLHLGGDLLLGEAEAQQRGLGRLQHGVAGQRAAGLDIHRHGLRRDNLAGQIVDRRIGNAGRLLVFEHLDGDDLLAVHRHLHGQLAAKAVGRAGRLLRLGRGEGHRHQQHEQRKHPRKEHLPHGFFLP